MLCLCLDSLNFYFCKVTGIVHLASVVLRYTSIFMQIKNKSKYMEARFIVQYIIIMSHCLFGFPWLSFAILPRPYHPSIQADPPDYVLCPYTAVIDKFLLVGHHLHVHVKGSIGERHLWVRPYFSSDDPHVLFVLFGWF